MDTSVPKSIKTAAKCDISCELQNSVNHRTLERILRLEAILEAHLFECRQILYPNSNGFSNLF